MMKGPLVYAAIALAALLMVVSGIIVLDRDLFLSNQTAFLAVSGVLAIAVVAVLVLMLLRIRNRQA
jgi:hypothetical protein